jgi:hypothetical protein
MPPSRYHGQPSQEVIEKISRESPDNPQVFFMPFCAADFIVCLYKRTKSKKELHIL